MKPLQYKKMYEILHRFHHPTIYRLIYNQSKSQVAISQSLTNYIIHHSKQFIYHPVIELNLLNGIVFQNSQWSVKFLRISMFVS